MAFALTKANIKAIPYGKEIGFSRGIMGRKLKDGQSVRMFLQKKLYGKPIKVKIGTWPDIAIDEIEAKAREYRSLIERRKGETWGDAARHSGEAGQTQGGLRWARKFESYHQ